MNSPASAASPHGVTTVAEDYLKVIWSATEWGESPATISTLSARFDTSRATASTTVQRLVRDGLLRHERYGSIELTGEGERIAVAMVRRHRLIETYLAQCLGYDWDDVHEEAERLEHAASEQFFARIDAVLGHPESDPHGDPIPAPDGAVEYPGDAVHLSAADAGSYVIVRVSDADPQKLRRLARAGVAPGVPVTVSPEATDAAGAVLVGGAPCSLGTDMLEAVIVRPR